MGDIVPFRSEAFDPDIIAAMSAAYERACASLPQGNPGKLVRELLAKRIVELAQQGHRDPETMYVEAMNSYGLQRSAEVPPGRPATVIVVTDPRTPVKLLSSRFTCSQATFEAHQACCGGLLLPSLSVQPRCAPAFLDSSARPSSSSRSYNRGPFNSINVLHFYPLIAHRPVCPTPFPCPPRQNDCFGFLGLSLLLRSCPCDTGLNVKRRAIGNLSGEVGKVGYPQVASK